MDIKEARKTMFEALKDPDLRIGYVANIAMLLSDRYNKANFRDFEKRNQAAKDILELLFK